MLLSMMMTLDAHHLIYSTFRSRRSTLGDNHDKRRDLLPTVHRTAIRVGELDDGAVNHHKCANFRRPVGNATRIIRRPS